MGTAKHMWSLGRRVAEEPTTRLTARAGEVRSREEDAHPKIDP